MQATSDPYDLLEFKEDGIPLEEVWPAMEECVRSGYAKSIGLSNFNSEQIERILSIASVKPVVNEVTHFLCTLYVLCFVYLVLLKGFVLG